MYVKYRNNQVVYPYDLAMLFRENPNTSFPSHPPDKLLADFGVYKVARTEPPTYDSLTEQCLENTPVFNADKWVQRWVVVKRSLVEASANTRAQRDSLLAQSDWTQLPDAPTNSKAAWATYRQALRDITVQSGFPFQVVWPAKP